MDKEAFFEPTPISDERKKFLKKYRPWVRFQISKRGRKNYRQFMVKLIQDFVLQADSRNEAEGRRLLFQFEEWNREGGIGTIWVDNFFILHCKMYLFDTKPGHGG